MIRNEILHKEIDYLLNVENEKSILAGCYDVLSDSYYFLYWCKSKEIRFSINYEINKSLPDFSKEILNEIVQKWQKIEKISEPPIPIGSIYFGVNNC